MTTNPDNSLRNKLVAIEYYQNNKRAFSRTDRHNNITRKRTTRRHYPDKRYNKSINLKKQMTDFYSKTSYINYMKYAYEQKNPIKKHKKISKKISNRRRQLKVYKH